MNRAIYFRPMTFSRYNDTQFLVYLNEEIIEKYVPEDAPEDFVPVTAYAYTGAEADGGTLISAVDDSRDSLINGILRTRYSQTEEDAIKTHQIIRLSDPACKKADEYANEWNVFNVEREYAIQVVDAWLN